MQMAIDAHLLSRASSSETVCFRVYQMSPPAVTIGRHQRWRRVIDEEVCRACGWDWTRRPTGGGALLHKDEINYALVAPRGLLAPQGRGEFRAGFDCIGRALAGTLHDMGFDPQLHLGDRSENLPQHGLCGRSITGSEIALGGRKIIAAAQMITPAGILQHGAIYLKTPDVSDRFWPQTDGGRDASEFTQRWTDLGPAFRDRPWPEVAAQFEDGFRRHLPVESVPADLSAEDWDAVEAIARRWTESGWNHAR